MTSTLQTQVLDTLQQDWGEYIPDFYTLTSEQQSTFLAEQGYRRFGDLLAHILAWWQEGTLAIENLLRDPAAPSTQYDVNAFNAQVIEQYQPLQESQIVSGFEIMRRDLIRWVQNLPQEAFENPRISQRLKIEIMGHLQEHRLPGSVEASSA